MRRDGIQLDGTHPSSYPYGVNVPAISLEGRFGG
jgi:hypothetical protein